MVRPPHKFAGIIALFRGRRSQVFPDGRAREQPNRLNSGRIHGFVKKLSSVDAVVSLSGQDLLRPAFRLACSPQHDDGRELVELQLRRSLQEPGAASTAGSSEQKLEEDLERRRVRHLRPGEIPAIL